MKDAKKPKLKIRDVETLRSVCTYLLFCVSRSAPLASKNHTYGCIYLWSWSQTKSQRPDRRSRTVGAVVLAELQWTKTEIPYLALNTCPGRSGSWGQPQISCSVCYSRFYCLSLCLSSCLYLLMHEFLPSGQAYVVCGDEKGRLWTYHINNLQKSSFQSGKPIQPTEVWGGGGGLILTGNTLLHQSRSRVTQQLPLTITMPLTRSLLWQVLEWPTPVRMGLGQIEGPSINSVAMDPGLHFLVALSDKNLVIVWKRESS